MPRVDDYSPNLIDLRDVAGSTPAEPPWRWQQTGTPLDPYQNPAPTPEDTRQWMLRQARSTHTPIDDRQWMQRQSGSAISPASYRPPPGMPPVTRQSLLGIPDDPWGAIYQRATGKLLPPQGPLTPEEVAALNVLPTPPSGGAMAAPVTPWTPSDYSQNIENRSAERGMTPPFGRPTQTPLGLTEYAQPTAAPGRTSVYGAVTPISANTQQSRGLYGTTPPMPWPKAPEFGQATLPMTAFPNYGLPAGADIPSSWYRTRERVPVSPVPPPQPGLMLTPVSGDPFAP